LETCRVYLVGIVVRRSELTGSDAMFDFSVEARVLFSRDSKVDPLLFHEWVEHFGVRLRMTLSMRVVLMDYVAAGDERRGVYPNPEFRPGKTIE